MNQKLKLVLSFMFLSFYSFSQTQEATIFFNDGDSIDGFGMIKNNKVKFRASLDSEGDFWDFESISKIEFYGFEMYKTYEYVKLKPNINPILLELVTDGEVSLYREESSKWTGSNIPEILDEYGRPGVPGSAQKVVKVKNYIKRKSDEVASCLNCGVFNNWRKRANDFFSDCEYLVKKIKTNELRYLRDIVEYYNDFCAE
jgi:hypothetical protein